MSFNLSTKSDYCLLVTWLSLVILLLSRIALLWLDNPPWVIWLASVLPLLIFIPGMLRLNLRSFLWLCFVCLLYFIAYVERLFAQPGNVLAIVGMAAVVSLFIAAMLFVRFRAREEKAATAQQNLMQENGE